MENEDNVKKSHNNILWWLFRIRAEESDVPDYKLPKDTIYQNQNKKEE